MAEGGERRTHGRGEKDNGEEESVEREEGRQGRWMNGTID